MARRFRRRRDAAPVERQPGNGGAGAPGAGESISPVRPVELGRIDEPGDERPDVRPRDGKLRIARRGRAAAAQGAREDEGGEGERAGGSRR